MSTATTQQPALPHAIDVTGSRTTGWWGMIMLLITDATLFGGLISAYFFVRFNATVWPLGGIARPELLLSVVASVVLLGSSIPMHLATRAVERDDQARLRIWLLVSFVMGAVFLGLEVVEWARADFGPGTNTYGSLFFTITGIHGLHVLSALLLNAFLQARAWLGHFTPQRHQAVSNVEMYWHFVDAVWVVIFATLYLSPYVT